MSLQESITYCRPSAVDSANVTKCISTEEMRPRYCLSVCLSVCPSHTRHRRGVEGSNLRWHWITRRTISRSKGQNVRSLRTEVFWQWRPSTPRRLTVADQSLLARTNPPTHKDARPPSLLRLARSSSLNPSSLRRSTATEANGLCREMLHTAPHARLLHAVNIT